MVDFLSPQVRVRFVDWGNEQTVPLHPPPGIPVSIRSLTPDATTTTKTTAEAAAMPVAAHYCCLEGFADFEDESEALQEATSLIDRLMPPEPEAALTVEFVRLGEDAETASVVRLRVGPTGGDLGRSVLDELKKAGMIGLVVDVGAGAGQTERGTAPASHAVSKSRAASEPPEPRCGTPESTTSAAGGGDKKQAVLKLPVGVECEVYCCHVEGIDSIHFHYTE